MRLQAALIVGGTLGLLGACAAPPTVLRGQEVAAPSGRSSAPTVATELREASAHEIRRAFSELTPESVNPRFLGDFLGLDRLSFQLVSLLGIEPALDGMVMRAQRMLREGVDAENLALGQVNDARAAFLAFRDRFQLASSPKARHRLRLRVRELALVLELHGWRLAALIYQHGAAKAVTWEAFRQGILAHPRSTLAGLDPPAAGMHRLSKALQHYEGYAKAQEARGSAPASKQWLGLRYGKTGSPVMQLRDRLGMEGFEAPSVRNGHHFGEALRVALVAFQRRQSLEPSGRVDRATLDALSIPFRDRVAQIKAVIAHLEGTDYYREPSRIVVNVPGFYLEHFEDGERVGRHRVVVGAVQHGKNGKIPAGGGINMTPLISGRLTRIVLNPAWHVPPRIKLEMDAAANQRPELYDAYRLYVDDRGVERAVQPPGPESALGRVKMGFVNDHGIFLHDTPRQELFHKTRRAFSHGCVRVENALGLARSLLGRDRGPRAVAHVDDLLRTYFETPLKIARPINVYLEYLTVGTGTAGEFRFFPDLYNLGHALPAARPKPAAGVSPSGT